MSVFSLIKRNRAQVKEHSAKKTEKAKEEAVKLPYKHVVTHAALDALSGAPSGWKHTDRPRIMEQNRRRSAMMANDASLAGMPRVGTHASIHGTPVMPLPKNYTHSNLSASWREHLSVPHQGHEYFGQGKSTKGKAPEYIHPLATSSTSRSSPVQKSAVSSQGVSLTGSSGHSNSSDEEPEVKKKPTNRLPENGSHHPNLSQKSSSSTGSINRMPLTSTRPTVEAPAKGDRHYPPQAQSTYFSAPHPLNRRTLSSDTSTPPTSTPSGRPNSTTSLPIPGNFSSASSVESIGLAIAPPMPPYTMTHEPSPFIKGPYNAPERTNDKATAPPVHPSPTRSRASTEPRRTSLEIIAATLSGHGITPPSAPAPRKRRRLSKSRPPSIDISEVKMSMETVRPDRPGTAANSIATDSSKQVHQQKRTSEVTVIPVTETKGRSSRKLTKNPEAKPEQKTRWPFRIGQKSSAVASH